jgi:ABC-type transporter Mla subunit MlaD
MDDHLTQLTASAERLASAADALSQALARLDEQQLALNTKIDRIVAAVSEDERSTSDEIRQLRERLAELERANAELKAQAAVPHICPPLANVGRTAQPTRKTLPPLVSSLLAKTGMDDAPAALDPVLLDRTLASLSLEQRIAVKAEMARAGLIE